MNSFDQFTMNPLILKAIKEMGYTEASPIQLQTLPILLSEETDFLGLAGTGTGKTAAFSIPLLEKIVPSKKNVQGLIMCPTRELALQVAGQINLLGKFLNIKALPVYGGASYGDQIRGLREGAKIVVGTPGRIVDHIERGTLILKDVKTVILDEADEMISMGFKEDIEKILSSIENESRLIWLFSATMNTGVRRVADAFLKKPKQVQVNRTEVVSTNVEQLYYPVRESDKPEILCKLIEAAEEFYGIVFCQTKSLVMDLTQYLTERGLKVDCLHGDKSQTERERTMQAFRDRKTSLLICTDVASRGLDVKDVTHVINYSIPRELDVYVHRIGRTARSGKSGKAMSLVTLSQRNLIYRIEDMTKSRMNEGKVPTRRDIGAKKVAKLLETFNEQTHHTKAMELIEKNWKDAIAAMTPEEIVGRFMAMRFPEVFAVEERARDSAPGLVDSRRNGDSQHGGNDRGGDRNRGRYNNDRDDRNDQSRRRGPPSSSGPSSRSYGPRTDRNDQSGNRDGGNGGGGGDRSSSYRPPRRR